MNDSHLIWEAYQAKYPEIEFVCVNSEFPESTDINKQKELYRELKTINGIAPLWQDWSDDDITQLSLTAIITDLNNKKELIELIKNLAVKHNIKIDMINYVSDSYVDRALARQHESQIDD